MKRASYVESERICEATFAKGCPWWHLYTPGIDTSLLFADAEDFRYAINLMARCHKEIGTVIIVAFEIMSNHIHLVVSGNEVDIRRFFDLFRRRLKWYLTSKGRKESIRRFTMSLKPIKDLRTLRNTIVYVNRNGYVADPDRTPYSDPWGTGRFYFGDYPIGRPLDDFSYREARKLLRSRGGELAGDYLVINGHISPVSFCAIEFGKAMFRNAHHYFSMISKNVGAYGELANELDDGEFLTDPELFTQVSKLLIHNYGTNSLRDLTKPQKLDLARRLRQDYHSSNGQIRRILGLTQYDVDSLFPLSAK